MSSVTNTSNGGNAGQVKIWIDFTKRFPQTADWLNNLGNGSRLVRDNSSNSKIVDVPGGVPAVKLIEFLSKRGVTVKSLLDSEINSLKSIKGEVPLCLPFLRPQKKLLNEQQYAMPFGHDFYNHEQFIRNWHGARIAGVTEVLFLCLLYLLAKETTIFPVLPAILLRCGDPIIPREVNIAVRIVPPACKKEKNGSILITTVDKYSIDLNIACLPFVAAGNHMQAN